MERDRFGRFIKEGLDVKVVGEVAYVAIWRKDQLMKAMFDREDLPILKDLGALVLRAGYACCKYRPDGLPGEKNRVFKQVSRIIMDCPEGMDVDHINGNPLDNRKCNLRIVTHLQNCQHRPILNKNNRSGARGVVPERYAAAVSVKGKRINLGTFDTIEEAARAIEKVSGRRPRKANRQSKTGIRGVIPIKPKAWVGINGKRHYLGSFDTIEEAEKAVNEKLKELLGT